MRIKFFSITSSIIISMWVISSALSAAELANSMVQGGNSDDQKYIGAWAGTFTTGNGNSNELTLTFIKDEKGKWSGKVKYTNPDGGGELSADFKSLEIAGGEMKAKLDMPDREAEATIEGKFVGNNLEGTYAITPKGSTEVAGRGSLKVAKVTEKKAEK